MSSPTRPKAKRRKVDKSEEKSEVDVLERMCAKRDDIEWLRETFIPRVNCLLLASVDLLFLKRI